MPPILADSRPLADPAWGMQAFTWGMLILLALGALIAVIVFFRRKPSVDVEFSDHNKDREALEARVVILEDMLGLDRDHKALADRVVILEDLRGLDRDHKALAERVTEIELRIKSHFDVFHRKLDKGAEEIGGLKEQQGVNSAHITDILSLVKEIQADARQREHQQEQRHTSLTQRMDETIRAAYSKPAKG